MRHFLYQGKAENTDNTSETMTHEALTVIAGVVIIATVGEVLRRARIGKAGLEELRDGDHT